MDPLSDNDKIFYEAVRRAIWSGLAPSRILEIVTAATK